MRIVINTHTFKIIKIILISLLTTTCTTPPALKNTFDENRAFQDILTQTAFGARIPGSAAHEQTVEYITNQMNSAGWVVAIQTHLFNDYQIKNIIAEADEFSEENPYVLIGAHYDSRIESDQDPLVEKRAIPVLGANDGASGVAVLLEIARVIPSEMQRCIRFVFFDAEDNGNIQDWEWIIGSRYYVANLSSIPSAVVILDMVGDKDLNLYKEKNSDPKLTDDIWQTAMRLGYDKYFIDNYKYQILDDHIPFIEAGIPAVVIIDFDYPYWHTSQDILDKISPESLGVVGQTIFEWLRKVCQDLAVN